MNYDKTRIARKKNEKDIQEEQAFNKVLGATMKAAREDMNLSQGEIADVLFTTTGRISHIENGSSYINAYELKLFCTTVDKDPSILIGYEGLKETPVETQILERLKYMEKRDKELLLKVLRVVFPLPAEIG